MPSQHKTLVTLRGTEQYERYLKRLLKSVKSNGTTIAEGDLLKLTEFALVKLGIEHGLLAPRRIPPQGTNRHGEPKETG